MLAPSAQVRGPIGKHTAHLVAALEAEGCTVVLQTWGRKRDTHSGLRRATGRAGDAAAVRRLLHGGPYDVLVVKTAHDWATLGRDLLLLRLCKGAGIPVVLQFHGSQPTRLWEPSRVFFRGTSRWLGKMPDCLMVLSSEEQRAWLRLLPKQDVRVVANPYIRRMRSVKRSGQMPQRPTVLFVGRLIAQKGIFDLIDAIANLADPRPRLVIVGHGPEQERLRVLADSRGVDLTTPGWLEGSALDAQYAAADVFVLPSWSEGFPTAVAEAMDAGLPIVTTRIFGMAEHLQDGVNALLVDPQDPRGLATALDRLLGDEALRRLMSTENRKKVDIFAPGRVVRQYLAILREVVE